jgi:hypothetical protein
VLVERPAALSLCAVRLDLRTSVLLLVGLGMAIGDLLISRPVVRPVRLRRGSRIGAALDHRIEVRDDELRTPVRFNRGR